MNIIFSTYEAKEIGGSYLRSLSIAQGLTELGHTVSLWTSAKNLTLMSEKTTVNGVLIKESIGILPYRFRKGGYDPLDILFRSIKILFSKADIVHSFNHRLSATIPGLLSSILKKDTKWFLDWADLWGKGGIADRRYGRLRFLTKNIDHFTEQLFIYLPYAITAISDDLVNKAAKIRNKKKNVYFLGVGADTENIKALPKVESRKKIRFPLNKKLLIYLYVGTYDEQLLAKLFIELCNLRNDTYLLLLGPELPLFEKIISKSNLANKRTIRAGVVPREKLSIFLSAGDAMLLPFVDKEINRGKFPNKLGDYAAAGRPIASNPTGEMKKILENNAVGILAPENPDQFAQQLNKLLQNDKLLGELGKNARMYAESHSWLSIAKQLEKLYIK